MGSWILERIEEVIEDVTKGAGSFMMSEALCRIEAIGGVDGCGGSLGLTTQRS